MESLTTSIAIINGIVGKTQEKSSQEHESVRPFSDQRLGIRDWGDTLHETCPERGRRTSQFILRAAERASTDLWVEGPAPLLHPAPVPNVSEGPAHGACFIADICTEKMLQ